MKKILILIIILLLTDKSYTTVSYTNDFTSSLQIMSVPEQIYQENDQQDRVDAVIQSFSPENCLFNSISGEDISFITFSSLDYLINSEDSVLTPPLISTVNVVSALVLHRTLPRYTTPGAPFKIYANYSESIVLDTTKHFKLNLYMDNQLIFTDTMTYVDKYSTGTIFSYTISLNTISSKYKVQFELEDCTVNQPTIISSFYPFIVSNPPGIPMIAGNALKNGNIVSPRNVVFNWSCASNNTSEQLKYYLYLTNPINVQSDSDYNAPSSTETMSLIYAGHDTSYIISRLNDNTKYYWCIISEDCCGILTQSPIYSFRTFKNITENSVACCPNPFNPNNEDQNIVFNAEHEGRSEIRIYTYFGEVVFTDSINSIEGINTYIYNGKNKQGEVLTNGSYILSVRSDGIEKKSTILILKR